MPERENKAIHLTVSQLQSEVTFDGLRPSPAEIWERVKEISGLKELELVFNDPDYEFAHAELGRAGFVFTNTESGYTILCSDQNPNYLANVTIAAMVDLGGQYDQTEPDDWRKWSEVKGQYSRRK